jgi:hypothetical protein
MNLMATPVALMGDWSATFDNAAPNSGTVSAPVSSSLSRTFAFSCAVPGSAGSTAASAMTASAELQVGHLLGSYSATNCLTLDHGTIDPDKQ